MIAPRVIDPSTIVALPTSLIDLQPSSAPRAEEGAGTTLEGVTGTS